MKDAARFALAIAAILSATALDAQQSGSSEATYQTEEGTLTVRSSQPDDPPPPKPSGLDELDSNGDGVLTESEASANIALTNEFIHADWNKDGRITRNELDNWIAENTETD